MSITHLANRCGIDIGQNGALAYINKSNEITLIDHNLNNYINFLQHNKPDICNIELVHSMPKQGVKSMFNFGRRLGEIEGILLALDIPYSLIPPKSWQKQLGLIKPTKQDIAEKILSLYPSLELYTKRGRLLDGRSDSVGLALYTKDKNEIK